MYQKQSIDGEWYNLNDNHVNNFLEKCNMIENNFKTIYNNSTLF
jgi:hypothetical protein